MDNGTLLAGVDLGSNSFRLEIGRHDHGQVHRTEYLKETVRLGAGLDDSRNLTVEAMRRGWECLARFGERLAGFRRSQVRAVATQTLREARNRDDFLGRAHDILGFPIEVISGREEARLIYQGVAHLLPQSDERRLVVDIGGRSTELILGQQFEARVTESYRVGSVAWSLRYFPDGTLSAAAFERARVAAQAVLEDATVRYGRRQWDVAYGSSGTIGAVGDILLAAGRPAVSRESLSWLQGQLIAAKSVDRVRLEGLKDDRRPVIGGGLSVLQAVFDQLDIQELLPAEGALRQGVVFDLLDREHVGTDVRSVTVQRLATKFGVDTPQATRVGKVARQLLRQLRGADDSPQALARHERKLGWAALLHEIGSHISHSDAHKHGAYILDHADAPGFAQPELHRLGLLVLGHRGKLRKLDADFSDVVFVHQLLCLRLAVILCHARRDPNLSGLQLRAGNQQFTLSIPADWARAYPQSAHLLREEAVAWQKTPWTLATG
ncbi:MULTISPECIES: Ppx/GppA phosphatase family protein [Ramlibacter]|uniref:Exopolyphosphatase n=1 Tax=Ramlibacter pinisoli TaxID=2682844 RepID=A0A6N8IZ51_9BURK|nr:MULTISPECIES: Ppx/GppA phosphatase family protein [Ramlibacter]MBA2961282.1 Ppx/GppA family phosphatase [Ramlibacter sp. CGMCC 1.13660]MVQ31226.1 exopolyphosphatase [Ramlibacter pinisoli]